MMRHTCAPKGSRTQQRDEGFAETQKCVHGTVVSCPRHPENECELPDNRAQVLNQVYKGFESMPRRLSVDSVPVSAV